MKKSGLTQGDRITGKVELWGVELSAIDCNGIFDAAKLDWYKDKIGICKAGIARVDCI